MIYYFLVLILSVASFNNLIPPASIYLLFTSFITHRFYKIYEYKKYVQLKYTKELIITILFGIASFYYLTATFTWFFAQYFFTA